MDQPPNEIWLDIYNLYIHDPQTRLALAQSCWFYRAEAIRNGDLTRILSFLHSKALLQNRLNLNPPKCYLANETEWKVVLPLCARYELHRFFSSEETRDPVLTTLLERSLWTKRRGVAKY
ncbi:hypothetical protein HDV00_009162 [Rhizophlyctis rosea]|nr:hypothetical protein HDV00_009162 [Rhizophlyctis rosea]